MKERIEGGSKERIEVAREQPAKVKERRPKP